MTFQTFQLADAVSPSVSARPERASLPLRASNVGAGVAGEGAPASASVAARTDLSRGMPSLADVQTFARLGEPALWTSNGSPKPTEREGTGVRQQQTHVRGATMSLAVQRTSTSLKEVVMTCTFDGCTKSVLARGWCATHYKRWQRHGNPSVTFKPRRTGKRPASKPRTKRSCSVDGCESKHASLGYCGKHYARVRRHGNPDTLLIGERGTGSIIAGGYRVLYDPSHPLAMSCGKVFAHRVSLYSDIGPGEHACNWCGIAVHWLPADGDEQLVVDHLDWDKLNNDPGNLVSSCGRCNINRHEPRCSGDRPVAPPKENV